MNIKFQCAYFTTKCGVRAGEITVTAENVILDDINPRLLLSQIDEREIFDYLNYRGFLVTQVTDELTQQEANADHYTEQQEMMMEGAPWAQQH